MAIQNVTIFGGSGFIGRHIVRRLAPTGAVIHVPTRDPEKALILKPMGDVGQIVPIPCSVRSDAAVARVIGASDVVINLLGILYEKGRDTFQSIHVEAAARIARLAHEQGVKRFVHLSALGASAESPSAYARSKAAGEAAVRAFFPEATILRPGIVFGAEDHFFNMFSNLARFSPVLPLIGGGHTRFQPVYVGDVAEAALRAMTRPEARGAIYELGGARVYSFRELLELLLRLTRRKRCLVDLPWPLATVQAAVMELFPHPLLTRDQVKLLKSDTIIIDPEAKTLGDLGITPAGLEMILPTYAR